MAPTRGSAQLPAKVSIAIDNTYEVVSEQLSHNVVGMVEGTDPKLKDTYVLFGAHLDHIGYSQIGGGAPNDLNTIDASAPAISCSTKPQSSAERHMGPILSSVQESAIAP